MKVAIILGSKSDISVMQSAADILKEFSIDYSAYVLSAHRVPEALEKLLNSFENEDYKVIIAAAGLAAHLPGVIASKTILPVIGVPIRAAFDGLDSLLSIVQMPKPIPVATVGVNNSYNAGMLAIQILATSNANLSHKLNQYRLEMKKKFLEDNQKVNL